MDETAWDREWDWHGVRAVCLRVARVHTRSAADAEDVAQEAAMRAWRRRDSLRDEMRRDEWLGRIARNEAMRLHERRARETVSEAPLRGSAPDAVLHQLVEGAPVRSALLLLTPLDRELIGLRYRDDLTQGAIAKRLGMPEGTIKVRLHRARAKLRLALAET